MAFEISSATALTGDPISTSVTITAGPQILILALGSSDARDYYFNATFDGVAMIRPTGSPQMTTAGEEAGVDWAYINLSDKASGTYTLYADSPTGGPDGSQYVYWIVKGIDPNNPINTSAGATGSSGSNVVSVTTTKTDCLVMDFWYHDDAGARTPESSQTQLYQSGISGYSNRLGTGYKTVSATGTYSMQWGGSSDAWASVGIALNSNPEGGEFLFHLL